MFPQRRGTNATSEEIRQNAVWEMYSFCHERNLREVWGYMWTSWYSPPTWKLWAWAAASFLSRLRTTMNVENFWRQFKHIFLQHVRRARLDQTIWILINRVTPSYINRMEQLSATYRLGRSKSLTTYQKTFKKVWRKLEKAYHLCKHLVQAVEPPSVEFWGQVTRRRTVPIYRHRLLVLRGTLSDSHNRPMFEGSITDGDDAEWDGDVETLKGGGGWVDMVDEENTAVTAKKRKQTEINPADGSADSARPTKTQKTAENSPEVIDLTHDSPSPRDNGSIDSVSPVSSPRFVLRSSSPGDVVVLD